MYYKRSSELPVNALRGQFWNGVLQMLFVSSQPKPHEILNQTGGWMKGYRKLIQSSAPLWMLNKYLWPEWQTTYCQSLKLFVLRCWFYVAPVVFQTITPITIIILKRKPDATPELLSLSPVRREAAWEVPASVFCLGLPSGPQEGWLASGSGRSWTDWGSIWFHGKTWSFKGLSFTYSSSALLIVWHGQDFVASQTLHFLISTTGK